MKKVNWESVLGQIDDRFLQEATESYSCGMGRVHFYRKAPRKVLMLAATIALLCALSLTACATNLFGIRDMLVNLEGAFKKPVVIISGYPDSNEYKAALEWETYKNLPKNKRRLHATVDDPIYLGYGAITHEGKETLDTILEKYGLKLHKQSIAVYDGDPQSLYDAVGISGFLPESCSTRKGTTDPDLPGCSVRDGITILSFNDSTRLPDGTQINYDLSTCGKGYMTGYMFYSVDMETVTEWHYTTKDGTDVLLCIQPTGAVLIADLDNCFLSIATSTEDLTQQDLETFADLFGFAVMDKIG